VKIEKKKFFTTKTNCKHSKGGYGRLQLSNVYTRHGFFQRTHEFKEADSKIVFHKLTQWFINKGIDNQLSTKFMKPQKQLHAIIGKQA